LLAFCTHQSHETLLQVAVDEQTTEIPVAQALLPTLPEALRVCTADALHTQVEFMRLLHQQHADTVLLVKENQPSLLADLVTYFADPDAHYAQAETWDRHRGRTEVRCLKVSTELTTSLSAHWPALAQVGQLTRTITTNGPTRHEVVYLLTSLSPAAASPFRLLELVRGHGSSEKSLHSVRDVTDRGKTAPASAPALRPR
jgi:predicted transposase YbfD/YdcC